MKKGLKGKGNKRDMLEEKYEEEDAATGGSSDDEMPDVVSNATMKSSHELVLKQLEHLKQQLRHTQKAKRRHKQEMFISQKKTKLLDSKREEEAQDKSAEVDAINMVVDESSASAPRKPTKKVYSSLNITVEPLTKVVDTRASSAFHFKARILAKVPRESVQTAVLSYHKKLRTRK